MTDRTPASLSSATSAIVADALDACGHREQTMDPRVRPAWPGARIVGRAFPVHVVIDETRPAQPYEGEMRALEAMRAGDVGVYAVDEGSLAAAWGELFSCAAIGRGVQGVVVDGCIRDSVQIAELHYPVFASGRSPLDTLARARVDTFGEPVSCAGVRVAPGDLVVADADGVVVVPEALVEEVAAFVANKQRLEQSAKNDLMAGSSIQQVWDTYQVF